ncbi:MAG TPA: hypothetical protein VFZ66_27580 [Herpetosiphonaceae bacterium]
MSEPDGAWFDPTASILDPVRAAARRPWPHDMLPKDYLITSGLYRRFMAPSRPAESGMAQPATSHALPDRTTAPTTLFDLDAAGDSDPGGDVGAERAAPGEPTADTGFGRGVQKRPPTNPALKKKYYALRAKANKVRGQHPRQARTLDAQADALMEPVAPEAPWRERRVAQRAVQPLPATDPATVDLTWLAGVRRTIERLGRGTPSERERAQALLTMMEAQFSAVGQALPVIPAPAPVIVLADHQSRTKETQDVPATDSTADDRLAA